MDIILSYHVLQNLVYNVFKDALAPSETKVPEINARSFPIARYTQHRLYSQYQFDVQDSPNSSALPLAHYYLVHYSNLLQVLRSYYHPDLSAAVVRNLLAPWPSRRVLLQKGQ